MKNLKIYNPGYYDRKIREIERRKGANIDFFNRTGFNLLFNQDMLNSINLSLIPFSINNKIGFINKMGEVVVEPTYEKIVGCFRDEDCFVSVCKNKKWTVINSQGKEILDYVSSFIKPGYDCPLATIQRQKRSKVVDLLTGKSLVNGGYDYIGGFRYGYARVRIGDNTSGKWGVIDETGKLVLPTEYTTIYSFYDYPHPTTVLKCSEKEQEQHILLTSLSH